ncbi:FecR domain-containing protein [Novosphingobium sp. AP12]|uniref:FecR family protein n=1 Tax=Novosphingobium sp. AP12 TaxID=1144305 RepID=UPI0002721525|nr:FecR domain-containing protein [Novosphingobium sp. AP12]EJL23765.1 Fe2+-dicitrate sensor, membrane component [Novosphingobium sp. AP12]
MASDGAIREQALGWAVRAGDPTFADWEAFMLWLEADPAHSRAYDEVTAAVGEVADLVAVAGPANDDVVDGRRPTRRLWLGGAITASLALVGALWLFQGQSRDLYTVQTALGETRSITLDPGTRVDVAGGTKLVLDRKDVRFAKLDEGQALFTVRHDAAHPFEVAVGDEKLVDIGTVFDVRHDARGALSVAVSEGAVQFDPGGADVRVSPGEVLRREAGGSDFTLSRVAADQVGEWRKGRLTFEAASLDDVAAQLKRATGIDYAAAPGGAGTVSGSILVAPLRKDPAAIGPLLGLSVRAQGSLWVIGSH